MKYINPDTFTGKWYYTYEVILNSGLRYIGRRSSSKPPELDTGYLGSSQHFTRDDVYHKIILQEFECFEDLRGAEADLHNYFDVAKNSSYINKYNAGVYCNHKEGLGDSAKALIKDSWDNDPERKRRLKDKNKNKDFRNTVSKALTRNTNNGFDPRLHHYYNTITHQSVCGVHLRLRANSRKLFNLSHGSLTNLRKGVRDSVYGWTYIGVLNK